MIVLRKSQIEILKQLEQSKFIMEVISHLRDCFKDELQNFTDDMLKEMVKESINKAAKYDLTSQQEIVRFVNVSVIYGWKFDEDPEKKWMTSILEDTEISNPSDRMDRLISECVYREETENHNKSNEKLFDEQSELNDMTDNDIRDNLNQKKDNNWDIIETKNNS